MSSREELLLLDEDLTRRKLELFEQRYITSKCELLRRIDGVVKNIESRMYQEAESKEKKVYLKDLGMKLIILHYLIN